MRFAVIDGDGGRGELAGQLRRQPARNSTTWPSDVLALRSFMGLPGLVYPTVALHLVTRQ